MSFCRILLSRRFGDVIAFIAIVSTIYLYFKTYNLIVKLEEIEGLINSPAPVVDNKMELAKVYSQLKLTGQLASLDINSLNNTRLAESQILIFNRVPKVGSQMIAQLLHKLAARNNFTGYKDTYLKYNTVFLDTEAQKEFAKTISQLPQPSIYHRHIAYTNFTRFNLPKPIYINLVRDPVERVISWYYYIRSPPYCIERKNSFPETPLPKYGWIRKGFEQCATSNDDECNYIEGDISLKDYRRQSIFFCGHDEICKPFNSIGAINQAKLAVEHEYSVVGVLEDVEITLAVLEKYIPQFFTGATEIYNENKEFFKKVNKNSFKPPINEGVKKLVREKFSREMEFYNFCKKRLYTQYIAANLEGNK